MLRAHELQSRLRLRQHPESPSAARPSNSNKHVRAKARPVALPLAAVQLQPPVPTFEARPHKAQQHVCPAAPTCSPVTCLLTMTLQHLKPYLQHIQSAHHVCAAAPTCSPITRSKTCCSWRAKHVWLGMQSSSSKAVVSPRIERKPHLLARHILLILLKLAVS